ncbi:MAG: peroxiredoxin family protein [Gemmataceae bacterium]|nr:peroxiredoxin family protein [Gemmataceae bacterium]
MESTKNPAAPEATSEAPARPWGAYLFCAVLFLVGCVFLGLTIKRRLEPSEDIPVPMKEYNVAEEAQKFVRKSKEKPLSDSLAQVLSEAERVHFESYQHPLVGKPAPEFTREDVDGKIWSLKEALKKGPVIVVFYLGYHCDHCVSQLFDLNEDIQLFEELGAQVVALSPDSSELTRKRYAQYGAFRFPVLSDHSNAIAEAYGVYTPAKDGKEEDLLHGTFVVDQQGIVRWAAFGDQPFGHNPTLLYEVAKILGKLP